MDPKLKDFLDKLAALTAETGFHVDACGCCDGPWVVKNSNFNHVALELDFNPIDGKYECVPVPPPKPDKIDYESLL